MTGVSPSSGPTGGGTSVTITGTNLASATAVKFGTTSATINTNTSTQITATSPAGSAGAVDITVTTGQGTSAISQPADQFTYVAAPSVTSVSTASGTYGGAISTYTIAGSNLPTSFNATGLPPGLSVNPGNGQITGTPTDTSGSPYSVTISATNAGGTGMATLTFTINQAALTISGVTAANKTYDGTTTATLGGTPALNGAVNGDSLTLVTSGATGTFADQNAGNNKTVNTSGFSVTGTNANNYTLTPPTTTASISAKTLTVSGVTASNKIYDGTAAATLGGTPALVGVVSGDGVTLNSSGASGAFADANVGTGKTVNASGFSLNNNSAGNYSLTQPTTTASISAKALTISGMTVSNKTYDGTTTATFGGTPTLVGVVSGDATTLNSSGASGTFADANVGTGKTVNASGFSLNNNTAGDYSLTQPTATASITAKALTVSGVTASNKIYDGTAAATLGGTPTLVGVVNGDPVTLNSSGASGTFADANVGTGKTVNASGFSLNNNTAGDYSLTQPTATASITAKALTVSGVTASSKTYDGTTAATLAGTAALLTAEPAGSGTTGDGAPYSGDVVSINGTPTVAFASKDVASNLAVTVSGYTLSGAQATNYSATQPAGLTANITAKTLTVGGVSASNKTYDGTTAVALSGTAALQSDEAAGSGTTSDGKPYTGDTVSLSGTMSGAFADKNAGAGKAITVSGLSLGNNSAGDYVLGGLSVTANITAKALTVSGLAASDKIYDGTTVAPLTGTAALATAEATGTGTTSDGLPYIGDTVAIGGTAAGAFASKDTANGIAVTVSGITLSGTQASNYSATQPTGLTANITAKALNVGGLTASDKVYDATTTAALSGTAALLTAEAAGAGTTSDGQPYTGDTISVSGTPSGAFATKDVGATKAVTISGLSLGGAQAADYSLTAPAGVTANITAKPLTLIGLAAVNKVYDATATAALSGAGALPAAEAAGAGTTSDGKPYTGDAVSVAGSASGAFASKNVGSGIAVTVSGLTLGGAQAADYSAVQPAGLSASITAKALTVSGVTAGNKVYDATTTAALGGTAALLSAEAAGAGTTSDGKPYTGDTVSLGGTASGTFPTKNIGSGLAVTVTGLTLSGAQANNYAVTQPTGLTANVTAKGLTVSGITANNKSYDGSTTAQLNAAGAALVGVVSGDTVTLSTTSAAGTFANASAGSSKAVTITGVAIGGADSGNYTLTQPSATANINQPGVTITLSNLNQTYDGSSKSVGVSTSPNVSTSTTYNGSGTAPTDAGSYSVAVSVTDSNYTGTASGTLTIAQASQTVTFSLGSGTIGSSVPLSASASSGLPVTFSIVSGSGVITPSTGSGQGGSSLTISGAGSITVRASQAGNANYQPASTDATVSGIAKLDQTIDFGALSDKRANEGAFSLSATASSGLPVTFTVASGPALLSGNTVTLSGAPGLVSIVASQAGNATYNAAPNVMQTFTVVGVSPLIYFGSIGGSSMAAEVNPDGKTGTMIGTLPGTGEGFVVSFNPNVTGDFVQTVTTFGGSTTAASSADAVVGESGVVSIRRAALSDPTTAESGPVTAAAGTTRTFRGHVSGGLITGSVDGVADANFSANLVPATGPTQAIAGYYQSSDLNTATGSIYSVVGTNNQVYVLAITPTYVGGNTGTANANGTFNVQAPGQTTISGSVDAPTTTVTGSLTEPGVPAQNFSGLAVTTIRTDRLINLSSRASVTGGSNVLIAGFVIGGATPKTVLLRGVGPTLANFGLSGTLARPMLQLYDSTGRQLLANSGWGGDATISATSARVGAFALSATSADAAMTTTLNPGAYTMVITNAGTDGGGIALAEIYDASLNPSADYQRLINISTRGNVANGGGVLIGGFVVTGNAPKKLLIRGVGPALTAFGVSGALADPQLQVFSNNATLLAQNNDWSTPQALTGAQTPATASELSAAANATGAFALPTGSKDAAVIVELAPGAYTAQVSGVAGGTGTALVEIYEVPTN